MPTPPHRLPVAVAALVGVLTCAAHAGHALGTGRLPRDLNNAWAPLPALTHDLAEGAWPRLAHWLAEPGGWLNALVGGWLNLVGPSGVAFRLATLPWLALLLFAAWWIAARIPGRWGGGAAVATLAQVPVVGLCAREGWVHIPEAALVAAVAAAIVGDPALERRRTRGGAALLGALALLVRPSGIGWMGALLVAWVAGARPPWRRALPVVGAWALAAAPTLRVLPGYLGGKVGLRERYAVAVQGLPSQLRVDLGPGALALVALALVLLGGAALARARARRASAASAPEAPGSVPIAGGDAAAPATAARRVTAYLLGGWLVLPFALALLSGAGLDNFPLLFLGLALVVGRALGERRAAVGLAVASWAATTAVQVARDGAEPPGSAARVAALLDAHCPAGRPRTPCIVVADQGLYFPGSEEPGRLELFLAGEEGVRFVSLHRPRMAAVADVVVTWDCGADPGGSGRGADRIPGRDEALAGLTALVGLVPAWQGPAEGCTSTWWTPTRVAVFPPDEAGRAGPGAGGPAPRGRPTPGGPRPHGGGPGHGGPVSGQNGPPAPTE